ncbi:Pre-mRNA-splicing factor cwf16 [Coemansia sp. RSA 2618]|nr:Pre-mRNA-splicing factor cwf16 [Coemansia sp. RSA 2618]
MSERKVLNKYFPPDFDPSKIPRLRLGKNRQIKVRLVAPFAMRCSTCGQWIGKGTKFNARKETVEEEKFHTIPVFRFYIRCQRCAAEITFKTDPENDNYVAEKGAQRNFEPWREEKALNEQQQQQKEDEEENNPIKALENRTEQSRREMEIMDALDEIRMQNARGERVDEAALVRMVRGEGEGKRKLAEDEEDEMLARQAFASVDGRRVKRACEDDAVEREREIRQTARNYSEPRASTASTSALSRALLGVKAVKKKEPVVAKDPETSLGGLLAAYGSDDDDDDDDDDEDSA